MTLTNLFCELDNSTRTSTAWSSGHERPSMVSPRSWSSRHTSPLPANHLPHDESHCIRFESKQTCRSTKQAAVVPAPIRGWGPLLCRAVHSNTSQTIFTRACAA